MSRSRLLVAIHSLLLMALACSLPGQVGPSTSLPGEATNTPAPSPTPLPPLPPQILETAPSEGGALPVDGSLTLVFNQPMDQASVESAFAIDPAITGSVEWRDERTLSFNPDGTLSRDRTYRVEIGTAARSAQGAAPREPLVADFRAAGYVEVTGVQPSPAAAGVDPTSRIHVAFNRPIVPLGAEGDGPQPLRFDPPVDGRGEWIGTSSYVFHPDSPLPAGTRLTAEVEAGLESPFGDVLASSYTWSFTTSEPAILDSQPAYGASDVGLAESVHLTFNQPMEPDSVQAGWSLTSAAGQPVAGAFEWSDDDASLTFDPETDLQYGTDYTLRLEGVSARGGAPLIGDDELSFRTVPRPSVIGVSPPQGGALSVFESVRITFSGPMEPSALVEGVDIAPAVESQNVYWSQEENAAFVRGDFQPDSAYRITVSGEVRDPYGTPLGQDYTLSLRTSDLPPRLDFTRFYEVLTLTPDGPQAVELQARNLERVNLELRRLSLEEYLGLQRSGVSLYRDPPAAGDRVRSWQVAAPAARNVNHRLSVPLTEEQPLANGVYLLIMDSPEDTEPPQGRALVVRSAEIVIKSGPEETFLWAVDLASGEPLGSAQVQLKSEDGSPLAEARLDSAGTARLPTPLADDPYSSLYAQIGDVDEGTFGLTNWTWNAGIEPFQFGVGLDLFTREPRAYLYSDRPLYRPGDTVHVRGVVRERQAGAYEIPSSGPVEVSLVDPDGRTLQTWNAPLSPYGTFSVEHELSPSATLGLYSLVAGSDRLTFDVSAYRKPEFSVQVTASREDPIAGQPLSAQVRAEYFSGGPVAEQEVRWAVYARPAAPYLPLPAYGLEAFGGSLGGFFGYRQLAGGSGTTDPDGGFEFEVPTDLEDSQAQELLIEASIREPGGAPVAGRAHVRLHPAGVYLSVRPQTYSGQVGAEIPARLYAADVHGEPQPGTRALISVSRLTWRQTADEGEIVWVRDEELINRDSLTTGADGTVLFSFSPGRSGTYEIEVEGDDPQGRTAQARAHVWVRGEEAAIWRQPEAGRLQLVPDRESYAPGDRAQVLIPSPYDVTVKALITLEQEQVLSHQIVELPPNGRMLALDLERAHMPAAYLSVTLLRPAGESLPAALSAGLLRLPVSAESQRLQIELSAEPADPGPGEQVRYHLEARDSAGQPVQAELSMAVVDQALLALHEPNSPDPFSAFYEGLPLRVRTAASLTLSALSGPEQDEALGRGGGGDLGPARIRSQFEDTAYWNPSIHTDENGRATVSFTLPDNLTTWSTSVRGVTAATEVGQATDEFTVTKPLLIRPLTPRFFTAGDQATVAAAVHNNSDRTISVEARLQAQGASLESESTQTLSVASQSVERLEWSLRAPSAGSVLLRFSVEGGGFQDASAPTVGSAQDGRIPVIGFAVPETAGTAGHLHEAGTRLESVSLPARYQADRGQLQLTLEPSLGAVGLRGLALLEESDHESTERTASRVLLNIAALHASAANPGESSQAEQRVRSALQTLVARQNTDGGWGWWGESPTDRYLTAYALHAILNAQASGFSVPESTLQAGLDHLQATLTPVSALPDLESADREALALYVLSQGDAANPSALRALAREPQSLSARGQALLLMALEDVDPAAGEVGGLLGALDSAAVHSATGAHWAAPGQDPRRLGGAATTTSIVVQALLQVDPGNALIEPGVRWLVLARDPDGAWPTAHDTAWAARAMMSWADIREAWTAGYSYQVALNEARLADGRFEGRSASQTVQVEAGLDSLRPSEPNALAMTRGSGVGSLSYTAHLTLYRPAEEVPEVAAGLAVERRYYLDDGECDLIEDPCRQVSEAQVGQNLLVRLSLIVPSEAHFVAVEDPYPAGLEPIDPGLETSEAPAHARLAARLEALWRTGWVQRAEIGDRSVRLFADHLTAGTYDFVYRLHAAFPGVYRVIPAQARTVYFPEVYGRTRGLIFEVRR